MAVLIKDIRLKAVIGNWYEYKPGKDYANDFATAGIDAAQINALLELHHKWAEAFGATINQNLKISCGTQETSVAKLKYGDLSSQIPGASTSFVADANADFMVVLDNLLAYALLDRACGGSGAVVKKTGEELTALEKTVLLSVSQELCASYRAYFLDALSEIGIGELSSPKVKPETKLKKDENVLVFSNTFYLADNKPAVVLFIYAEKVIEKLAETYFAKLEARPKKVSLYLSPDAITNVKVPVNVKIGSTTATIGDILNLTPGDVFQLKEKITDSLILSVAEQGEFFVQLGRRSDNYAVKILEHRSKYYTAAAPSVAVSAATAANAAVVEKPVLAPPIADTAAPAAAAEPLAAEQPAPAAEKQTPEPQAAAPVVNNIPVPSAPAVVEASSVQYTQEGKVDAEKLEFKDPLLEELNLTADTAEGDSDDFTWDIDDLK